MKELSIKSYIKRGVVFLVLALSLVVVVYAFIQVLLNYKPVNNDEYVDPVTNNVSTTKSE